MEIPGYYYDAEKKKYFKIQKNSMAPSGAYSQDKVQGMKRKQEDDARRQRDAKRKAKEKIQKATFYQHPLIDSGREIGTSVLSATTRLDNQALVFASDLEKTTLHSFRPQRWRQDAILNVRHIARTKQGHLITGGTWGQSSAISIAYPSIKDDMWTYSASMERVLSIENALLTSLSLGPMGHILSTFEHRNLGPGFDGTTPDISIQQIPNIDDAAQTNFNHQFFFTQSDQVDGLNPLEIGTIWSSAASQKVDKPTFAIGAERGLHFLVAGSSGWSHSGKSYSHWWSRPIRDVLSLDWVDDNLLAFGMRNAGAGLYDMRVGDMVFGMDHLGSAQVVRQVDEYRLLVAGPEVMAVYDTRFTPPLAEPGPVAYRRLVSRAPENAYLTFPDYAPTPKPNIDVCKGLGLAVSSANNGKVQLFSMQTGCFVESPLTKHESSTDVNCVVFDYQQKPGYEEGDSQTPVVLVGGEHDVDQWAW